SSNERFVVLCTLGAVNRGCAVFALVMDTVGPESWRQEYAVIVPSGSEEARPARVTLVRRTTVRSVPAFAMGGRLETVTVVVAGVELVNPSFTTRLTVNVPSVP